MFIISEELNCRSPKVVEEEKSIMKSEVLCEKVSS